MSSRIGRKYASATYPQSPGAGGGSASLARNNAVGPNSNQLLTTTLATNVVWAVIASTGVAGPSVPITPQVTGDVVVEAVISAVNADSAAHTLTVAVAVGGTPVGPTSIVELGATGLAAIPVQVPISGLPIGTTSEITVQVTASAASEITLSISRSSVFVREVAAATG